MGWLTVSTRDYDGESSTVTFPSADLTAANIVAQMAAGDALVTAMAAIENSLHTAKTYVAKRSPLSADPRASDATAHRELKWLVMYHDDTTFEKATLEIPCPDLAEQSATNRGHADIGDAGVVDAFITAFEAFVLGPGGNASVVDDILIVGRNV